MSHETLNNSLLMLLNRMVVEEKRITSVNLNKSTYDEAVRIHAYNGYRSLSELVEHLLSKWIKEANK